MHILLIKMSSMGDIIHTLPALTDAMNVIPNLQVDWVIEPAFADIPTWHPCVKKIIPISLRLWRKNIFSHFFDMVRFYKKIRQNKYDAVIDAQGLLKSAFITKLAKGPKHGCDKASAREWMSSFFYHHKYAVNKNHHAVMRLRSLFSKSLNYPFLNTAPNFYIKLLPPFSLSFQNEKYFVFIHGTTWETKLYPETYWEHLLQKSQEKGITVYLPWGNEDEKERAKRWAKKFINAIVLPKLSLSQCAVILKNAAAVISVDTGLGHLSAALNTFTLSLYGPTNPKKVGALGDHSIHLQAQFACAPCETKMCLYNKENHTNIFPPCFTTLSPDKIWKIIEDKIMRNHHD